MLNNGSYEQYKEWMVSSGVLGTDGVFAAGACGKCSVGLDLTTKERFCVKIVRTFFVFCSLFKKDKLVVLLYLFPSIAPGADLGVQAVSLQVTLSHPPDGRLSLLSATPAVTFPAEERHRS